MACGFSESKHREVLLTVKEKKPAFGTTENAENLLLFNNQHEAGKRNCSRREQWGPKT